MTLKVTFLGTGTSSGVPMVACHCPVCASTDWHDKRLRCSAMVELLEEGKCSTRFTIDAGPDFRQQMLANNVDYLDAIVLTHQHIDHIGGLDDVRSFNYFNKRPMDIYGENQVLEAVKRQFAYAFAEPKYPGVPELELHTIEQNRPFRIGDVEILPIRLFHYNLPIFGYRIGDFSYLTDGSRIEDSQIELLKGSKVLVINTIRREEHISHFSLNEALEVAEKVGAEHTYLTHLSHQIEPYAQLKDWLKTNGHPTVEPAFDGLQLTLPYTPAV